MALINIGLRGKIWMLYNLTVLSIVVFSFFYFPTNQLEFLLENENKEIQFAANALAANVSVALEEENFAALTLYMQEIRNDPRLQFVGIYEITQIPEGEPEKKLFQSYPSDQKTVGSSRSNSIVKHASFSSQVLSGEIVLEFSTEGIQTTIGNLKRSILISGSIVFLIGSILSLIVSTRITRPLNQLTQAATNVGAGNLDFETPVGDNDEVGKLVTAFNKMKADLALGKIAIEEQTTKLKMANKELALLNEEKNNIIGVVAHDLKSPLANIEGLIEIFKLESTYKDEIDLFGHAKHSLAKMNVMIKQILYSQALESGAMNADISPTPLLPLVEQAVDDYRAIASRKDIEFVTRTEISKEQLVQLDPNLTEHILDNLISNAIKFSPHGKKITIGTFKQNGCVAVAVEDEGPGISKEDQVKMFQRFKKLTASPTGGESSTGLGLFIVKKLAELMDIEIQYQTPDGDGAIFEVRFRF